MTCGEDLGKTIKERRKYRGMTLYDLSAQSGVSPSHLDRIERNERFPSGRVLRKIAKPLGYDEHELFTLAGYLSPQSPEDHRHQIDPYVAGVLSQYPFDVQRAVVGILYVLKSIAKTEY